jgi:NADH:ubiquinone oxidoreductase subunit 2 (subunit N)
VAAIALQFAAVAAAAVIAIVAALQEPASGHKPEVADMKGGSEHRPAVAVAVAVVVAVVEGAEPHMVVEEPGNIPGLSGDHQRH